MLILVVVPESSCVFTRTFEPRLVCVPELPTITAAAGNDPREHTAVASCRGDKGMRKREVVGCEGVNESRSTRGQKNQTSTAVLV